MSSSNNLHQVNYTGLRTQIPESTLWPFTELLEKLTSSCNSRVVTGNYCQPKMEEELETITISFCFWALAWYDVIILVSVLVLACKSQEELLAHQNCNLVHSELSDSLLQERRGRNGILLRVPLNEIVNLMPFPFIGLCDVRWLLHLWVQLAFCLRRWYLNWYYELASWEKTYLQPVFLPFSSRQKLYHHF